MRLMNRAVKKLLKDIRTLIESTRGRVAQTLNAGLVMLNWSIGQRIREDALKNRQAEYGKHWRMLW